MLNLISLGATTFSRVKDSLKVKIKKQVEVLNLISLGATTFLRVKDSLKMQLLIENPSLITSPKLQNLAFWVSQVFDLFILQKNPCG
jgi:hypothetical protein